MYCHARRTNDVMGYVSGVDVLLGVLPWYHIYGQTIVALAGLKGGTSVVSMPKFSPELFLNVVKKYKVNRNLRVCCINDLTKRLEMIII